MRQNRCELGPGLIDGGPLFRSCAASKLFHGNTSLHIRMEGADVGNAACFGEGVSPGCLRSYRPRIKRRPRCGVRSDVIIFPFDSVPFLNFDCRRRKLHVFRGHMHDHRLVGVCDGGLDSARRSRAGLNSLRSGLGGRRVAAIQVRGGKIVAVPRRKKSCKKENDPPKDQHPERKGLDRNACGTSLKLNGSMQILHTRGLEIIDTLPVLFS